MELKFELKVCNFGTRRDLPALKSRKSAENQSCPPAIEKLKYLIFEFGENRIGKSEPLLDVISAL